MSREEYRSSLPDQIKREREREAFDLEGAALRIQGTTEM